MIPKYDKKYDVTNFVLSDHNFSWGGKNHDGDRFWVHREQWRLLQRRIQLDHTLRRTLGSGGPMLGRDPRMQNQGWRKIFWEVQMLGSQDLEGLQRHICGVERWMWSFYCFWFYLKSKTLCPSALWNSSPTGWVKLIGGKSKSLIPGVFFCLFRR